MPEHAPHREFLVQIDIVVPVDMPDAELDALRAREAARAAELAEEGALVRLWRVPDRWANWGLWRAPDLAALESTLGSLPLSRFMTVQIHETSPHPSDPLGAPSRKALERS